MHCDGCVAAAPFKVPLTVPVIITGGLKVPLKVAVVITQDIVPFIWLLRLSKCLSFSCKMLCPGGGQAWRQRILSCIAAVPMDAPVILTRDAGPSGHKS
eukprot:scaffold239319_cov15-Tisochrysis_lutea.AAC.3